MRVKKVVVFKLNCRAILKTDEKSESTRKETDCHVLSTKTRDLNKEPVISTTVYMMRIWNHFASPMESSEDS